MFELPEIRRKKPKQAYRKPDAVKQLERMADQEARMLHPTCPHLAPRTFKDNDANSLTKCVVEYIRLNGGFASRISNQGTFSRKLNRYIPATSRKGLPDILGTYQGKSLFIEVKAGRDRMSTEQEKIRDEQNRSGGCYFIAKDFTTFKNWFDSI